MKSLRDLRSFMTSRSVAEYLQSFRTTYWHFAEIFYYIFKDQAVREESLFRLGDPWRSGRCGFPETSVTTS